MRRKTLVVFSMSGGTLSMEDLRSFKVQEQEAWTVPLGDIQMHVPPPPSGGPLLAFILKIMKGISRDPDAVLPLTFLYFTSKYTVHTFFCLITENLLSPSHRLLPDFKHLRP